MSIQFISRDSLYNDPNHDIWASGLDTEALIKPSLERDIEKLWTLNVNVWRIKENNTAKKRLCQSHKTKQDKTTKQKDKTKQHKDIKSGQNKTMLNMKASLAFINVETIFCK